MKVFLISLGLCSLFFNAMSQKNDLKNSNFIGKWKLFGDSISNRSFTIFFIDKETVEIELDSFKYRKNYIIESVADFTILTLMSDKTLFQKFVIIPESETVFYLNSIEDDSRYLEAKKARPGNLAWGWSNPNPIKFVKQKQDP